MSWQAVQQVLEHSPSRHGARLLMLAIAHHAKPDGSGAFPSITTLCRETKLSERAIWRHRSDLEASGELSLRTTRGNGGRTFYTIQMNSVESANLADLGSPEIPDILAPVGAILADSNLTSSTLKGDNLAPSSKRRPAAKPISTRLPERRARPEQSVSKNGHQGNHQQQKRRLAEAAVLSDDPADRLWKSIHYHLGLKTP